MFWKLTVVDEMDGTEYEVTEIHFNDGEVSVRGVKEITESGGETKYVEKRMCMYNDEMKDECFIKEWQEIVEHIQNMSRTPKQVVKKKKKNK